MKKLAAMVGLAIGDALGMPFEFSNHSVIDSNWNGEYRKGTVYKELKPGQWTDDTKMAICLARSLVNCGGLDVEDVSLEYIKWYNSGDLRGIGIQTGYAIQNMISDVPLEKCGEILRNKGKGKRPSFRQNKLLKDVCGNGTAMRVAPVGLFFRNNLVELVKAARSDAILTHDHQDAKDGSIAVSYIAGSLANGARPLEAVQETIELLSDGNVKAQLVLAEQLATQSKRYDEAMVLGASGTAHETVASAAFCLLRYCDDGFKHVVVNAVRMGGDTDTRTAIAGAWAGIYIGLDDIPTEYIDELEHAEFLIALDTLLYAGPDKIAKERKDNNAAFV